MKIEVLAAQTMVSVTLVNTASAVLNAVGIALPVVELVLQSQELVLRYHDVRSISTRSMICVPSADS